VKDARIFLGVSGGIAAYKAAALTSTLVQRGARVDVVMTAEAERFISPLTFASLTARPVYTSLWDAPERIPHIRLVREAEVALVAPATANLIAKLAAGIADDLLTAALLAARIPRILAPAMNEAMYEDSATQANLGALRGRGYEFVEPERGFLAEREIGSGRLASEERLLAALERALTRRPRAAVMVQAVGAPGLQITCGQRPQMRPHRTQHHLIPSGQILQASTDRDTGRPRNHERRGKPTSRATGRRRWGTRYGTHVRRLATPHHNFNPK